MIELHLLYKTVYISIQFEPSIESKKVKYCIFWHENEVWTSWYFNKRLLSYEGFWETTLPCCNTHDYLSNDILDMNFRCPEVNIKNSARDHLCFAELSYTILNMMFCGTQSRTTTEVNEDRKRFLSIVTFIMAPCVLPYKRYQRLLNPRYTTKYASSDTIVAMCIHVTNFHEA